MENPQKAAQKTSKNDIYRVTISITGDRWIKKKVQKNTKKAFSAKRQLIHSFNT